MHHYSKRKSLLKPCLMTVRERRLMKFCRKANSTWPDLIALIAMLAIEMAVLALAELPPIFRPAILCPKVDSLMFSNVRILKKVKKNKLSRKDKKTGTRRKKIIGLMKKLRTTTSQGDRHVQARCHQA